MIDVLVGTASPYLHTITLCAYGRADGLDAFDWHTFTLVFANAPFVAQLKMIHIIWVLKFDEGTKLTAEVYKRLTGRVANTVRVIVEDSVSKTAPSFDSTNGSGCLVDRHHNVYGGPIHGKHTKEILFFS